MIKSEIGKHIKRNRENAKLSQTEVAARMGVTRQTISSWEINRTQPSIQDVERLAQIFECSIHDILGDYPNKLIQDRNLQVIMQLAKQLTNEQQRMVIDQMEYQLWKNKEKDTESTTA